MSEGRNRRRITNYLINRTIQGRIVAMNLSFMCIIMILTMAIMILYTPPDIYDMVSSSMPGTPLARFNMPLEFWLYLIIAVTFAFAVASQIWLTHRVCGSLVNFMHAFNDLASGKFSHPVVLRKDDLLMEEAEVYNRMILDLGKKVADLKADNQALLTTLKTLIQSGDTAAAAQKLLEEQEKQYKAHIEQFTFPIDQNNPDAAT